MSNFTIFALPRSGTAWASVWLGATHDPLDRMAPNEAASLPAVCCTGMWMLPDLCLRRYEMGRVLILDRPLVDVNKRGADLGMQPLPPWVVKRFAELPGPRFTWTDLWDRPWRIWRELGRGNMSAADLHRHSELARLQIQIDMRKWAPTRPA